LKRQGHPASLVAGFALPPSAAAPTGTQVRLSISNRQVQSAGHPAPGAVRQSLQSSDSVCGEQGDFRWQEMEIVHPKDRSRADGGTPIELKGKCWGEAPS
jgi:hypothetical protein